MKATGIVRQLDSLGRIVLPIELRRTMDINAKDLVEIYVEDNLIILKKHHPCCIFCYTSTNLHSYMGKQICDKCCSSLQTCSEQS